MLRIFQNKLFLLICILILASVIITGGYFLVNKMQEKQLQESKIEAVDTSDWKIYRNEKYGLQLRYPSNWFINEDYPKIYIANRKITKEEMGGLTHGWPGSFEILIYDESDEWPLEQFERRIKLQIPAKNINDKEYTKIKKVKIGEKDVFKEIQFGEADMASVGGYVTDIWFLNRGYLINFIYPNEYNEPYDYRIYEEIFSTLKIF